MTPAAKFREACTLHQRGELARARTLYEEVLRQEPRHAGAVNLLAMIAGQTGDFSRAAQLCTKAVQLDPANPVSHNNRGMALQSLKRWEEALASFDQAIKLKADYGLAHCNRGNTLKEMRLWDAALASYDRAIEIDPGNAAIQCNRGVALENLGRHEAALESYDRAIAMRADFAEAHYDRGNVLKALGDWESALASYERAVAINPGFVEAHFNKGFALYAVRRLDAALESYDRAIALRPDYAEAYSNRGTVQRDLMQWEAAASSFDRAIELKPDYAEAHVNKGIASLQAGDLLCGWTEYEWRWKLGDTSTLAWRRAFSQPRWSGREALSGKTILLHDEQGLGDTLQFCRYAREVARLGATVILEVQKPLVSLLESLPGVSRVIARGDELPPFDYWCPLMSVPLAVETRLDSIPHGAGYLRADAGRVAAWQAKLGPRTKPRIGLTWGGSTALKSIPLAELLRHLPSTFEYVSLQKEMREADRETLNLNASILNFADELRDFGDTAALAECLDAVISVDTSVAHLCGALGRPTWVMLMASPDWRWLLDRGDSPWYPTVRLYRQDKPGDWGGALERVAADLRRSRS
jgi:tetratricopeptide (TPR) repeat protein